MSDLPRQTTYSLFFDLFVLSQRIRDLLAAAMATAPLSPEEYATYSVIFEDEAVSPTAMAAQLSMALTTVVDAIRTMERRGHVRRIPNPRDGRSYLVVLTGDGLRAHAEAHERFEVGYQAFLAELSEGETRARQAVAKLLGAAERALDATVTAERPPHTSRDRARPSAPIAGGHSASSRRAG